MEIYSKEIFIWHLPVQIKVHKENTYSRTNQTKNISCSGSFAIGMLLAPFLPAFSIQGTTFFLVFIFYCFFGVFVSFGTAYVSPTLKLSYILTVTTLDSYLVCARVDDLYRNKFRTSFSLATLSPA